MAAAFFSIARHKIGRSVTRAGWARSCLLAWTMIVPRAALASENTNVAQPWPFWLAGAGVGLLVVLLAWVTGKAFGVSTSYASLCSALSGLPYFKKKPFNESWRLWFLVGLPIGGFLASVLSHDAHVKTHVGLFETVWGHSTLAKAVVLGAGGFLVGFGSRWAGG